MAVLSNHAVRVGVVSGSSAPVFTASLDLSAQDIALDDGGTHLAILQESGDVWVVGLSDLYQTEWVHLSSNKDEDEVRLLDALRRNSLTNADGKRPDIDRGALFEWARDTLAGPIEGLQRELKEVTAPFSDAQRPDLYTHVLVLLMLDSLKTEEVLFARVVGDALGIAQADRQRLTETAQKRVPNW